MKTNLAMLVLGMFWMSTGVAQAATLLVTTNSDSGAGSLRQALLDANTGDVVQFTLGGNANSITVYSTLAVNKRLLIDGAGQQPIIGTGAPSGYPVFNFTNAGSGTTLTALAVVGGYHCLSISANDVAVLGCRIGTDWLDAPGRGPVQHGIFANQAQRLHIGAPGLGNTISNATASGCAGVLLYACREAVIQANRIGTNTTGLGSRPNYHGIRLYGGTQGTLIGGDSLAGEGNLISGNTQYGIRLENVSTVGNTVAGNLIGMRADQSAPLANAWGVSAFFAGATRIGLSQNGYGNLIAGNTQGGVLLEYTTWTVVQNNIVGLDSTGLPSAWGTGIKLDGALGSLVGGNRAAGLHESNVISGFYTTGDNGVLLTGSSRGNTVAGNYIGTDLTGNAPCLSANDCGIRLNGAGLFFEHNLIGGPNTDAAHLYGNVISGNVTGIYANTGNWNYFLGNYIGLNAAGSAAVPNNTGMITGGGCARNMIGSSLPDERNVIAGNQGVGLQLYGSYDHVLGNYFGTAASGLTQIRNTTRDLDASGSGASIGEADPATGNLLCGGLKIFGSAAYTSVVSNRIGVLADGSAPAVTSSVGIEANATGSTIGISGGGGGNLIAHALYGINLPSSGVQQNGLFGNTICACTVPIGRANGANNNQPAPVITSATLTLIQGTAQVGDAVEVFKAEPRSGQGGSLIRLGEVTADASQHWSVNVAGISAGDYVTALATDASNNTSLFAVNVPVSLPTPSATPTVSATVTCTPSHSPTWTVTQTSTPTLTFSPTPSVTGTPTVSATVTVTPSRTPTLTVTPTHTHSATVTLTPTISVTATVSPTVSETPTASPTPTLTPTTTPAGSHGGFVTERFLAFPNPAYDWMSFALPIGCEVNGCVDIYNMNGERVVRLTKEAQSSLPTRKWDCRQAAPGIYLARLWVDGVEKGRVKVAVIRK